MLEVNSAGQEWLRQQSYMITGNLTFNLTINKPKSVNHISDSRAYPLVKQE